MSRDRDREAPFSYFVSVFGFAERFCSYEERRGGGQTSRMFLIIAFFGHISTLKNNTFTFWCMVTSLGPCSVCT